MRPGLLRDDLPALLGLVPPVLWLGAGDGWLGPRLLICVAVICGWQAVFAGVRGQGMGLHGLVSALLVAIFVPQGAPFWQVGMGLSFGMVLGEAIFGGRGRNFVQPVVLALAFMAFSFTDQPWREGPQLPLAVGLPALVLLVISGQARLLVLAGLGVGLIAGTALIAPQNMAALASGSLLIAALYLVADPVVSGATPISRLVYGLFAGALAAVLATSGPAFGALIFAGLLAQVFAPLFDFLAIAAHGAWMRRRSRVLRHG